MVSSIHSAGGRALTNCMRRNCVWTAEESASETVCRPPIFDRPPLRVMSPTLTVLPVRLVYCIVLARAFPVVGAPLRAYIVGLCMCTL